MVWKSESVRVSLRCSFVPVRGSALRRSRCSGGAQGGGSRAEQKLGGGGRALPGPGASVRSPAGPPCLSSSAVSGGGGLGGKGSHTAEVRRTRPGSATLVRWGGSHLPTRFSSFGAGGSARCSRARERLFGSWRSCRSSGCVSGGGRAFPSRQRAGRCESPLCAVPWCCWQLLFRDHADFYERQF